ncbi:MAG: cytochrome c oxidase subunit 3 [Caenibius sp.]
MSELAEVQGKPDVGKSGAGGSALPCDSGVLFFICADMGMFALFFLLFTIGQVSDPETYRASRAMLDPAIGLANTLILIVSGWLVVRAVEAGRAGDWAGARLRVIMALVIGSGFAFLKVYEYAHKFGAGITPLTNEFFTYYFAFTGIHFLHFAIGVGVLLVTISKLRKPQGESTLAWLESAGAYWHMVDLLWVVLFPLLYLAGGVA